MELDMLDPAICASATILCFAYLTAVIKHAQLARGAPVEECTISDDEEVWRSGGR